MASGRQSVGIIALLGVIAVGVVAALFGILRWSPLEGGATSQPGATPPQTVTDLPAPRTGGQAAAPAPAATPPQGAAVAPAPASPAPAAKPAASSATAAPPAAAAPAAAAAAPAAGEPIVPSFDVVRVEPNGESVIAGRSAPGATIEMLRDGQVHARTPADLSGLFALVPPALPPGAHEIVLQSIAPDGTRRRSKETVTIVINDDRSSKPLVALLAPDKPTVVLSSPDQQEQRTAAAPTPTVPASTAVPAPVSPQAPVAPAGPPAARPEARIVTVEAEDGGRLFVSGKASPGATVRLYLNESFVGSGGVDRDGQVAFHIGRGVRPGDYRVRIDDVDPVTGSVKSRAEVAFNVPAPPTGAAAAVAAAQPPTAPGTAAAPAATADRTAQRQGAASPDAAPPAAGTPVAPPTSAGTPAAGPAPAVGAAPSAAPARAGPPAQVAAAAPSSRELPTGTVVIPDIATAIVAKGDNLWRISHRVYGKGTRYTVIYSANQTQIRNPHRIYPGQVFVLPGDQQAKSN